MKIIPFKAEHARYITARRMNNDLMKVRPEYMDMLDQLEKPNMSWTGIVDDKIIATAKENNEEVRDLTERTISYFNNPPHVSEIGEHNYQNENDNT